jgi:hypothetical protein
MDALYQREQFWAGAKPNKKPVAGGVPNRNYAQPSKRTGFPDKPNPFNVDSLVTQ